MLNVETSTSADVKLLDLSSTSSQKLSKTASMVSSATSQQNHFDEHICLPVASLMQDCTMLFENVYDHSYDLNQQNDACNTDLKSEVSSNGSVPILPENPISTFVCDQPVQSNSVNSVDSYKMICLMSEISKKLDVVINHLVESNNLQKEVLERI